MAQNYYIYENEGRITILPWDYNLAWGGFQSGDASAVINFPIDTPVSGVEMSSRPLIEKLLSNPEYLESYHTYIQELVTGYFADGKFEEKLNSLDSLIGAYVENDKTAFCNYEEYKKAVSAFVLLGNLRAQSIQGQLDGAVPSTTETQRANASLLITAEGLNLSDLGSMMGGGKGGFPGAGERQGWDNTMVDSPANLQKMNQPWGEGNPSRQGEMPNRMMGEKAASFTAKNNLILISALLLVLIVTMILMARYKKKY